MPIVWFTGFNGTATRFTDNGTAVFTSDSSSIVAARTPFNYVNASFGRLQTGDDANAPMIRAYGRKWSAGSVYQGYAHMWIDNASWDANSKALVCGGTKTASSGTFDFYYGVAFNAPTVLITPTKKKYRLGWRMCWPESPADSNSLNGYGVAISPFENVSTPLPIYTLNLYSTPGVPFYYELEFDPSNSSWVLFRDGVRLANGSRDLSQGVVFLVETYYTKAAQRALIPAFEISDMYWQSIESDADVALGPGTIIRGVAPSSDSEIEFTRPDGYSSNASVVFDKTNGYNDSGTTSTIIPSPNSKFLIGDGAGQQDLYNLDISNITSQMASVEAVRIRSVSSNPGVTPSSFSAIAKVGTTQVESPVLPLDVQGPYKTSSLLLTADPSDGSRWNTTKLGRLKIGTKLQS